jgi:hypothetical protein
MAQTNNAINAPTIPSVAGQTWGLMPQTTSGLYVPPQLTTIPGINRAVNGSMRISQRAPSMPGGSTGTVALAAPTLTPWAMTYTCDRFQLQTGAGNNCTYSQTLEDTGLQIAYSKIQRNTGSNGISAISHATTLTTDMIAGLQRTNPSISFRARAGADFSAANNILTLFVAIGTGTASANISGFTTSGTGSTFTEIATANFTLVKSTSPSDDIFATFTLPSSLGANVTQVQIGVRYIPTGRAGADDSFKWTALQLENSPCVTPFQFKNFYQDLWDCLPFFQKTMPYSKAPAPGLGQGNGEVTTFAGGVITIQYLSIPFVREIFNYIAWGGSKPSITFFNPVSAVTGANQAWNLANGTACSNTLASADCSTSFSIVTTLVSGGAGDKIAVGYSVDGELY